jgi:hypothetical protein
MKSDCTTCYYFVSWRDEFFGDPMEPSEFGRCYCSQSPYYHADDNEDINAGEDKYCDYHESKIEEVR